jgi:hypothetical protein
MMTPATLARRKGVGRGWAIAHSWLAVRNGTWMIGWAIRYETV